MRFIIATAAFLISAVKAHALDHPLTFEHLSGCYNISVTEKEGQKPIYNLLRQKVCEQHNCWSGNPSAHGLNCDNEIVKCEILKCESGDSLCEKHSKINFTCEEPVKSLVVQFLDQSLCDTFNATKACPMTVEFPMDLNCCEEEDEPKGSCLNYSCCNGKWVYDGTLNYTTNPCQELSGLNEEWTRSMTEAARVFADKELVVDFRKKICDTECMQLICAADQVDQEDDHSTFSWKLIPKKQFLPRKVFEETVTDDEPTGGKTVVEPVEPIEPSEP